MDERRDLPPEDDPAGDTEMFRAFVRDDVDETAPQKPVGTPFRILTLLAALAVFAGIVWLLLR